MELEILLYLCYNIRLSGIIQCMLDKFIKSSAELVIFLEAMFHLRRDADIFLVADPIVNSRPRIHDHGTKL